MPVLLHSEDDYGLDSISWGREEESESRETLELGGKADWTYFESVRVPADDAAVPGRWRWSLRARDAATPVPQETEAQSPWVEVVTLEDFEERLGERMARAREVVDRMLSRVDDILDEPLAEGTRGLIRRVRRDLDGLQIDLETALLERLYAGIDRGSEESVLLLNELLRQGSPGSGSVVAALSKEGAAPPLDQSGRLLDLGVAASYARSGAALQLAQHVADGLDPTEPARELQAQLETMMKILVKWEDFQSAINLLRGLLERQRQLYLRTRSVTDS